MFIISMTLDVTCAEHFVVTAKNRPTTSSGASLTTSSMMDSTSSVSIASALRINADENQHGVRSRSSSTATAPWSCAAHQRRGCASTRRARSSTRSRSSMQHVVAMRGHFHCGDLRAISGVCLTAGHAVPRESGDNEQTTSSEPHTGLQGKGGAWPSRAIEHWHSLRNSSTFTPIRSHRGKRSPRAVADVFGPGGGTRTAQPAVDAKSLHAKIGELTLENDF